MIKGTAIQVSLHFLYCKNREGLLSDCFLGIYTVRKKTFTYTDFVNSFSDVNNFN